MTKTRVKAIFIFVLGVLIFALAAFIANTFFLDAQPKKDGIIEDWGQICFWPDGDGLYASVSPQGCYSTTCTRPTLQTGTAIVDVQNRKIQLETRFVLVQTSRFPLPCIDNCAGGGLVQFKLAPLMPNDYEVWFGDLKVGEVHIFSGRTTPRQCFENTAE
jgi:hypothetical protein